MQSIGFLICDRSEHSITLPTYRANYKKHATGNGLEWLQGLETEKSKPERSASIGNLVRPSETL
jgi:hypothetical protein